MTFNAKNTSMTLLQSLEFLQKKNKNALNACITILSKIYFYFTAGIVDTTLKKREEQRLR